jgi:catechol 2,3-dioxygenase-like lactoylglutathione lyase family enzyme
MFKSAKAFSSFSVNNLAKAREFYTKSLGLSVTEEGDMGFRIRLDSGVQIFIYSKENHVPATYTILNFPIANIDQAVDELKAKGIQFEQYTGELQTDEKGICRSTQEGRPRIGYIPITPQDAISNNHLVSNLKSFSIGKTSQYNAYCCAFPQSKLFNFLQSECYNLASCILECNGYIFALFKKITAFRGRM